MKAATGDGIKLLLGSTKAEKYWNEDYEREKAGLPSLGYKAR